MYTVHRATHTWRILGALDVTSNIPRALHGSQLESVIPSVHGMLLFGLYVTLGLL